MAVLRGSAAHDVREAGARARPEPSRSHPLWVMVLAGGEGTRLSHLTRDSRGRPVPKQFCSFHAGESLLASAVQRALRLTDTNHVLPVVMDHHRKWWITQLHEVEPENIVVQPGDRGTGIAVLHALVLLYERDPEGLVVVVPADQDVADDGVLRSALERAVRFAAARADDIVMLGTPPTSDDPEYGWIVPRVRAVGEPQDVSYFVERPAADDVPKLKRRGAVINMFLLASSVRGLLHRFLIHHTSICTTFMWRIRRGLVDLDSISELHEHVPRLDFGCDLLERAGAPMRLIEVPPCGWADLGTQPRVEAWARRRAAENDDDALLLEVPDPRHLVHGVSLRSLI